MNEIYQNLTKNIETHSLKITEYLESIRLIPPIYSSVDLRIADFKVAPVDTNIFPAGFGVLSGKTLEKMSELLSDYLNTFYREHILNTQKSINKDRAIKPNIIILHESFDRNAFYLKNLEGLKKTFAFLANVELLSIDSLNNQDEYNKTFHDKINQPNLIILNADLTKNPSQNLLNITIPIIPSIQYGWYKRSKFNHFSIYNKIAFHVASIANIDPWLITSDIDLLEGVDFRAQLGLDKLAKKVDDMIGKIQKKYDQYAVSSVPKVFLKPDCGTFGMGIMVVNDGSEVININKKRRHSISKIRDGILNSKIFLQEAIPTNQFTKIHNPLYGTHNTLSNEKNNNESITENQRTVFDKDVYIVQTEENILYAPSETILYNIGYNNLTSLIRFNVKETEISNLNSQGVVIKENEDSSLNIIQKMINDIIVCAASLENE